MGKTPGPGEIFYLKEDKPYQVITMGFHKETGESMIIYQALFGEFKTLVLPLNRFVNEVQKDIIKIHKETDNSLPLFHEKTIAKVIQGNATQDNVQDMEEQSKEVEYKEPEEKINPILVDFLDAETYSEKLEVITTNLDDIDNRLINNMAVSVDCNVDDGNLDERLQELIYCLNKKSRFEDKRLR